MDVKPQSRYFNRELSWIEFNQKVLDEAFDPTNPLLERLKFLAITASNLDEFFMVRVGGLMSLLRHGVNKREPAGFTTAQQLRAISERVHEMVEQQCRCLFSQLTPALESAGVYGLAVEDLNEEQSSFVSTLYEQEIFPALTPRAVVDRSDFPNFPGMGLNLAVRLEPAPGQRKSRFALVALPSRLSRFITVPTETDDYVYLLIEDLVASFIDKLFPGQAIREVVPFRITRNADMSVKEDEACDLLAMMRDVLRERRQSFCVRLEIAANASKSVIDFLKKQLDVDDGSIYRQKGPLNLSDFFSIAVMGGFETLTFPSWEPKPTPLIRPNETMFDAIARHDMLLFHPYESYDPIVRFISEAADDYDVLAIKQILYRTSKNSPIIDALIRAAESGKSVTVIVELKARFDEARNIQWAERLEQAGALVIYGVRNLKTHAKICVVVRREPSGVKRYTHFGTGNYNESTAKLYSDVSYMTCGDEYGVDASRFFNTITGYSQALNYQKIAASPIDLKSTILAHVEDEIQRKKSGQKAKIMAKVNSLVDIDVIEALYRASQAGVEVKLNVRGICCLRPGVDKLSENIQVVSVVGRFLEHARVIYFHQGGEPELFISSADWMPRNLEKRVELLVPVDDPASKKRLIRILECFFADNRKGRLLAPDGSYAINEANAKKAVNSQEAFAKWADDAMKRNKDVRLEHFETHRPS